MRLGIIGAPLLFLVLRLLHSLVFLWWWRVFRCHCGCWVCCCSLDLVLALALALTLLLLLVSGLVLVSLLFLL